MDEGPASRSAAAVHVGSAVSRCRTARRRRGRDWRGPCGRIGVRSNTGGSGASIAGGAGPGSAPADPKREVACRLVQAPSDRRGRGRREHVGEPDRQQPARLRAFRGTPAPADRTPPQDTAGRARASAPHRAAAAALRFRAAPRASVPWWIERDFRLPVKAALDDRESGTASPAGHMKIHEEHDRELEPFRGVHRHQVDAARRPRRSHSIRRRPAASRSTRRAGPAWRSRGFPRAGRAPAPS